MGEEELAGLEEGVELKVEKLTNTINLKKAEVFDQCELTQIVISLPKGSVQAEVAVKTASGEVGMLKKMDIEGTEALATIIYDLVKEVEAKIEA